MWFPELILALLVAAFPLERNPHCFDEFQGEFDSDPASLRDKNS
jgi:hypothetical protein